MSDENEDEDVCGDQLEQDGWLAYCAKKPEHEPPHEGTGVHAENSEIASLCWEREYGGIL